MYKFSNLYYFHYTVVTGKGQGRKPDKVRLSCFRIYVALAVFQSYRYLEAGDTQSLKS